MERRAIQIIGRQILEWLRCCVGTFALPLALSVWGGVIAVGMLALAAYSNSAGTTGDAPAQLPIEASIGAASPRFTLLMFLHPKCPCSRASISELARLMSNSGSAVEARLYFYRPESAADIWAATDLWWSAKRIPHTAVAVDPEGRMAASFGAHTSGEALLYDPQGRLRFQGGITAGRGHAGDNLGRSAVESLVRGSHDVLNQTPVFGCTIVGPCAPPPEKIAAGKQ